MKPPRTRAYVSGPLTNRNDLAALRTFYERIGRLCERKGMEAYVPHHYTDPILHADIEPEVVYRQDMRQIAGSDLVIAYVGLASHGVGAEVERAYHENVDVILLYEHGARVSRIIRGCPAVVEEVGFSDFADALEKLDPVLDQWLDRSQSADRDQPGAS